MQVIETNTEGLKREFKIVVPATEVQERIDGRLSELGRRIRLPGFRDYDLIPGNWWFLGITSAVCLVVLLAQTYRISRPQ